MVRKRTEKYVGCGQFGISRLVATSSSNNKICFDERPSIQWPTIEKTVEPIEQLLATMECRYSAIPFIKAELPR